MQRCFQEAHVHVLLRQTVEHCGTRDMLSPASSCHEGCRVLLRDRFQSFLLIKVHLYTKLQPCQITELTFVPFPLQFNLALLSAGLRSQPSLHARAQLHTFVQFLLPRSVLRLCLLVLLTLVKTENQDCL